MSNIVESRVTFLFALMILGLAYWMDLAPDPYKEVKIVRLERSTSEIEFVATFQKTACEFKRLAIVGGVAGETEFLKWRDLDGLDETTDRTVGSQTIRIAIQVVQSRFEWIEIRTQHICSGEKVDKIFYRIEPVI